MKACGRLIFGGFAGTSLPARFMRALVDGRRAGAIVFGRNVEGPEQVAALNGQVLEAGGMVAVDQEGGPVARLKDPVLKLPPMRRLGFIDDPGLTERVAHALGTQLRSLGFSIDFAPVLDVDSNPDNPVIGDRSFGSEPDVVTRHGLAFARGLQAAGIAACGKHFPGHGDTDVDSHLALPVVARSREVFDAVELAPFRAAAQTDLAAVMSAHVVYRGPEGDSAPATLDPRFATALLREELGFDGVLFSDDLEMGALSKTLGLAIEDAAVAAVRAGCDAVLICSDEEAQDCAFEALVRETERDAGFAARVTEAAGRIDALRERFGGRVEMDAAARLEALGAGAARALAEAMEMTDT